MKDLVKQFLQFSFEGKMTRQEFQTELERTYGKGNVQDVVNHQRWEDYFGDEMVETTTDYYVKGNHVAEWSRGVGKVFRKAKWPQRAEA